MGDWGYRETDPVWPFPHGMFPVLRFGVGGVLELTGSEPEWRTVGAVVGLMRSRHSDSHANPLILNQPLVDMGRIMTILGS